MRIKFLTIRADEVNETGTDCVRKRITAEVLLDDLSNESAEGLLEAFKSDAELGLVFKS